MEGKRRTKEEVEKMVSEMKRLEAEGKSRKEIGLAVGCCGAEVTRRLGAVRPYRGKRLAA